MDISPARLHQALIAALDNPSEPLSAAREQGALPLNGAERFAEHCGEFQIEVTERDRANQAQ
jgi:hypothetical protein